MCHVREPSRDQATPSTAHAVRTRAVPAGVSTRGLAQLLRKTTAQKHSPPYIELDGIGLLDIVPASLDVTKVRDNQVQLGQIRRPEIVRERVAPTEAMVIVPAPSEQ